MNCLLIDSKHIVIRPYVPLNHLNVGAAFPLREDGSEERCSGGREVSLLSVRDMNCPHCDDLTEMDLVLVIGIPDTNLCFVRKMHTSTPQRDVRLTVRAPVSSATMSLKHPFAAIGLLLGFTIS